MNRTRRDTAFFIFSRKDSPMLLVWVCAIFLGAGLLFMVQPMIAKMILPLLGGSPAVWNTCIVFFQAVLLSGYLYAHLLTRLKSRWWQVGIHSVVLVAALAALPVGLPANWKPPAEQSPIWWLLLVLVFSVGGPFFVLSSAGPLLQNWFAGAKHRLASDPYFLYASSNAGSMLALLGYPIAVEPLMALPAQRALWSVGYVVFMAFVMVCGLMVVRSAPPSLEGTPEGAPEPLPLRTRAWWVLLAFVPSSLMLGVTQHLSTNITTFPLLWVIPLALYLLTFIVVFSKRGRRAVKAATVVLPVVVVAVATLLAIEMDKAVDFRQQIMAQIVMHLLGLLVIGLFCHGQLAAERPETGRLTEFYLLIAIGGVLGGAFNSLMAPVLFDWITEYPIAIVLACLLRWWTSEKERVPRSVMWRDRLPRASDVLLPILIIAIYVASQKILNDEFEMLGWNVLSRFGLPAMVCLLFAPRRLRFALGVAALMLAPRLGVFANEQLYVKRTFFGVHQVLREREGSGHWYHLWHGSTRHGMQYDQEPWTSRPTTYFTTSGPVGDVMRVMASDGRPRQIAFIGLGIGTLAAYGHPEWQMTYYEIDPEVVRIAKDQRFFTYLSKSRSPIDIVLGDARLMIAAADKGRYDLILVDAFSSDAIPVHLITREAVELYLEKLKPDGILMFHITNWYLDLSPVLGKIASELKLVAAQRKDGQTMEWDQIRVGKDFSKWVVLARKPAALGAIARGVVKGWKQLKATPGMPVWTDGYSNILGVFKYWM